jgi:hypothetical protein
MGDVGTFARGTAAVGAGGATVAGGAGVTVATPPAAITGAAAGDAGLGATCATGGETNSVRGQLSMIPTAPITRTAVTSAPSLNDFDDAFFEDARFEEPACGAAG